MGGTTPQKLAGELLGSAILAGTVIGSGVLATRFSHGNDAVALLGNTAATGAMLFVLVSTLGPLSGAHFNPAVSMVMALRRQLPLGMAVLYITSQVVGCIGGAWLAHAMFELPILQLSQHERSGGAQMLSEGVATFALVFTILATLRWRPQAVPAAVALVITAGYWWTASTSFANPAITIARALSDTFAGVRPADAPGFIAAQLAGALAAWTTCAVMLPKAEPT